MRSPYHTNRFVATLSRLSHVSLLPSDSLFDVALESETRRQSLRAAPSPDLASVNYDNSAVTTSAHSSSRFSSYSPSLEAVDVEMEDINMNWVDGEMVVEEVNDNRDADGASQRWIDPTPQFQGILGRDMRDESVSFDECELESERPECDGDVAEPGWRNSLLRNTVRTVEGRNLARESSSDMSGMDRIGDGQSTGNDWNVSWNSERLGDGESDDTIRRFGGSSVDTTDSPLPSIRWTSDAERPLTDDLRWITDFNRLGDGFDADSSANELINNRSDINTPAISSVENEVSTSSDNQMKGIKDCDILKSNLKRTDEIVKVPTVNDTHINKEDNLENCKFRYEAIRDLSISTIMEQSVTSLGDEVLLNQVMDQPDDTTAHFNSPDDGNHTHISSSTPIKTCHNPQIPIVDRKEGGKCVMGESTEVQLRRKREMKRDPALRHSDPAGSANLPVRKRVSFHLDSEDKSPDTPKQKPILVRHSLNEEKLSFFSQIFPGLSGIERGSEATSFDDVFINLPMKCGGEEEEVSSPETVQNTDTTVPVESTKIRGESVEGAVDVEITGEREAPEGQEDPLSSESLPLSISCPKTQVVSDVKGKGLGCGLVEKPALSTNNISQTYHTSVRTYVASLVKSNTSLHESNLDKSQLSESNPHLAVTSHPTSALSRLERMAGKVDSRLQNQLAKASLRKPQLSVSALALRKIRRGILKRGPLSLYPKEPSKDSKDESEILKSDEPTAELSEAIPPSVSRSPSLNGSLKDLMTLGSYKSSFDSRGSSRLHSPTDEPDIPLLSRLRNHLLTNSLHRVFEWSDCSGGPVLAGLTERSLCLVTPLSLSPYFTIQTLPYSDIDTVALGPGGGEVLTLITKDARLVTLFTRGGSREFCSRLATTTPSNNTSINYRHLSLNEFTRLHTHHSLSNHFQECGNKRCGNECHLYYRWVWSCRPWALSAQDQILKRTSHLMYLVNGKWIPAKLSLSGSCVEIKSEVERVRYRISDLMGCDRSTDLVAADKSVSSRLNQLLSERSGSPVPQPSSTRPHTFRLRFRNKGCYTVAASDDYEVSLWMQSILLATCHASSDSGEVMNQPSESMRHQKTLPLSLSGSNLTCSTSAACVRPRCGSVHSTLPPTVEWLSLVADESKVYTANLTQNISSCIAIEDMTCILRAPQICLIEIECCEAASSDGDLLLFFSTEESLDEFIKHLTTVRPEVAQVLEPMMDSHPLMAQSRRTLDQILTPLRNLVQAV